MNDVREIWSPNYNERKLPISMIVLHYTGMESGEAALERLINPTAEVSAHYLVEEDGRIFHLVAEEKRAWHAGSAHWRGITDVNSASVGVEIVNPGHEHGYREFPADQLASVMRLVHGIKQRWAVLPENIVGHSDVSPQRKQDPGELFPWENLAKRGLALARPRKNLTDPLWTDAAFLLALERFGYDVSDGRAVTIAFQRRFRPENVDGRIDGECRAILRALLLPTQKLI